MDWTEDEPNLSIRDWNLFSYSQRKSVLIQVSNETQIATREVLHDDYSWADWLKDNSEANPEAGLYTLLCSRAPDVFLGQAAPVSYLPFSREIWQRIAERWHVHRTITRTVARRVAYISAASPGVPGEAPKRSYLTARMSAELPNDLGLSVAHVPEMNSTFVVVYGCNGKQIESLWKRVRSAGFAAQHPLVMVGIFAELERERLVGLGDDLIDNFTLRSDILDNARWNPQADMTGQKSQEYLALCVRSRVLIDHIRAVKRQLRKFLEYVDETDGWLLRPRNGSDDEGERVYRLEQVGRQIRKRIREIMDEYDDKIDECNMMSENLSLTMQTLWNQIARHDSKTNTQIAQVNTVIALETKRDNAQMRSIALLTMIYIPLSCVASVFSTSLFDFQAPNGKAVVSRYFWVFMVVSIALTAVTVLAWHLGTNRDMKKENRNNSFALKELGIV